MSQQQVFLFGMIIGAWLNMWTPAIGPWASFVFPYILAGIFFLIQAIQPWKKGK